jgi:hypothetical protein
MKAELTTDSTMSHYGIPVLRLNGNDYGPKDVVGEYTDLLTEVTSTKTMTAAEYVCLNSAPGHCFQREYAVKFCAQWPEGPQPK